MGQALLPVQAVTNGSNPLSLLPKQAEGLGPCCPKTVCPSNSPSGSFQKLHIPILHEKSEKMINDMAQYFNFHLKSSSSLVCNHRCSKKCQLENHIESLYNIEKSENAQFAMNWFKTFTNHIFEVIKLQNC